MSQRLQGYFYLTLAMVTVGSTVVASKVIAAGMPPFAATALRFAVALPVFVVLMRLAGAARPKLEARDWAIMVLQSAAGSVGYTVLLILGLRLTSAADAGVVTGTLPIVAAAISVIVLGERPDRRLVFAVALAAVGVLAITVPTGGGMHSLVGNALVFAAVVGEGLFILLNKRMRVAIPPLVLSTWLTGIGLVLSGLAAVAEAAVGGSAAWPAATPGAVLAIVYYGLVPTVGGFLAWYAGAARVSGVEASLFTALAPVTAVLLAVAVLGETIGSLQVAGIGLVLAAVLTLGLPRRTGDAAA
ncbi:DMT family transporter [Phreatobacter sp. AB_2022a]|uniref:DMT family transporter n=1 Tax=Phreatobacter sp. AB_2022a TaxID=3003134 RepID=UPI00228738C3|nr:DMT family transporter [Phreatobacter sp. AB_2022a]MCZ0735500.1 DMT family transporter [Phreatobacter sp. AB_2022a]